MPKTFKKVSPIKYREVLATIEKIILINNADEKNHVLNDLYRIVHPFVGTCNNRHDDWRQFQEEMRKNLWKKK